MSQATTDRFIQALHQAEDSHDPAPLVPLFGDDAELANLAKTEHGTAGAAKFWGDYLAAFARIKSEFHAVTVAGERSVLEWTSTGELPGGKPIVYRGVSVLEFAGGKVAKFRTYYDSAAFVTAGAEGRG